MTTDHENDLDWLAFCYAAGELDSAEVERFEARLADDQAAREALARAVELTQTIAAAETQVGDLVVPAARTNLARTNLHWNRRLSWMAIGGLASVLLALLWSGFVGPTWHTAQNRLTAQSRYQLAMAWNETRDEFAGVREAALWLPVGAGDMYDETAAALMATDEEAVADTPSWMFAAVFSAPRDAESTSQSTEPPANQRLENE